MKGALFLASSHARHHKVRSLLFVLLSFVSIVIPLTTNELSGSFAKSLRARADSTPLVVGSKGSRFDLVMSALYFRTAQPDPITFDDARELAGLVTGEVIPLRLGHAARGLPLVCTTPDYFTFRGLTLRDGTLPQHVGEVVLGSEAAERLGLATGAEIFSDPSDMFNLAKEASLRMRVVGVLEPRSATDNGAIFGDLKTAWVLEGYGHAHAAAEAVPDALVLEKSATGPVISESLVADNTFSAENAARFHLHATEAELPLSAAIVVPRDAKEFSLLKARTNADERTLAVSPSVVVEEMLTYVARIQSLVDGLSVLLACSTVIGLALVSTLAAKVREREILTLTRIGGSRAFIRALFAWEIALLLSAGAAMAVLVWLAVRLAAFDLMKLM
ncbi:MAG: ABC transporter permease [Phycisphaerales bacterium]